MKHGRSKFLVGLSTLFCFVFVSLGFYHDDNFLINCGSSNSVEVGDRTFVADNSSSYILSTQKNILATTNINVSTSSPSNSELHNTARILTSVSRYTFAMKKHGRHWIRLHFFPFIHNNYNMSSARFSVSAENFTLLQDYNIVSDAVVKEFSLNIISDKLVLTFSPSSGSFAFINSIEVFSLPDELIPEHVSINSENDQHNLGMQALETVARVNMGNVTVSTEDDTLWRSWDADDDGYLIHSNLVVFDKNVSVVNFRKGTGLSTENIAPASVYGTATRLMSEMEPRTSANVTWNFDVDPGFGYLVRFHFCQVSNLSTGSPLFNVYVNSRLVSRVDLSKLTSNTIGDPHYIDAITMVTGNSKLNVSVGTSDFDHSSYPNALLNGLEIMKLSNSKNSLVLDLSSKKKIGIIVGSVTAAAAVAVILGIVFFLLCRRRKRAHVGHTNEEEDRIGTNEMDMRYSNNDGTHIFSSSKIGYRFQLAAIREATANFSDSLIIGVGGFGKVYKGVLRDETEVAVKRGVSDSSQGLVEFKTEIEMLSQFRHRHLVSLIGYCNERDERIIIYEFMKNGTLKNHLYGSDFPCLSWRKRLDICIGSARGLHYLHTGSTKAIIHRDVKSANILLDENFMAKVADFGLSKTGPEIDKTHVSTAVKGSFGYLDPEYLVTQQLTEKSDVYSFGVVMFEVLCGRPVMDPSQPREKVNLSEWVLKQQQQGQVEDIVDARLEGQIKPNSLGKFVDIANKCLAERGMERPTMGDVLWNLECALQLQGAEKRCCSNITDADHDSSTATTMSFTSMQHSEGSMSDLAGVSMSKVFARMVREDSNKDMR